MIYFPKKHLELFSNRIQLTTNVAGIQQRDIVYVGIPSKTLLIKVGLPPREFFPRSWIFFYTLFNDPFAKYFYPHFSTLMEAPNNGGNFSTPASHDITQFLNSHQH